MPNFHVVSFRLDIRTDVLIRLTIAVMCITLVSGSATCAAHASSQTQHTFSPGRPAIPGGPRLVSQPGEELDTSHLSLQGLKAVLVVGYYPEDPTYGPFANQVMDLIADELITNGVDVYKFYSPSADWTQITAAAQGAQFFVYYGHGLSWSVGPSPDVGGLRLDSGTVSPDTIRNELQLAPGAIVMIGACYAAGTGSSEYGETDIGIAEAQRRAAQYADPFLDVGALGYYGTSFGWNSTFLNYVRDLFSGQSLGEVYESLGDFNPDTVTYGTCPDRPSYALWIDKDFDNVWIYNQAFVGLSDLTLQDLFDSDLHVQPSALSFLAALSSEPQYMEVQIDLPQDISWTAAFSPTVPFWTSVSPDSGTGPQDVVVQVMPDVLSEPGAYQTIMYVTSTELGAAGEQESVSVTLNLAAQIHSVYLPSVVR